jgi:hypothetical protein
VYVGFIVVVDVGLFKGGGTRGWKENWRNLFVGGFEGGEERNGLEGLESLEEVLLVDFY